MCILFISIDLGATLRMSNAAGGAKEEKNRNSCHRATGFWQAPPLASPLPSEPSTCIQYLYRFDWISFHLMLLPYGFCGFLIRSNKADWALWALDLVQTSAHLIGFNYRRTSIRHFIITI